MHANSPPVDDQNTANSTSVVGVANSGGLASHVVKNSDVKDGIMDPVCASPDQIECAPDNFKHPTQSQDHKRQIESKTSAHQNLPSGPIKMDISNLVIRDPGAIIGLSRYGQNMQHDSSRIKSCSSEGEEGGGDTTSSEDVNSEVNLDRFGDGQNNHGSSYLTSVGQHLPRDILPLQTTLLTTLPAQIPFSSSPQKDPRAQRNSVSPEDELRLRGRPSFYSNAYRGQHPSLASRSPPPTSESMSDDKSTISSLLPPRGEIPEDLIEVGGDERKSKRRRMDTLNSSVSLRGKEESSLTSHTEHDALQKAVTALYANILVILGFALPLSEVISNHISEGFFEMFYVFLFLGSLLFLLFNYIDKLQSKTRKVVTEMRRKNLMKNTTVEDENESNETNSAQGNEVITNLMENNPSYDTGERVVHTVYGSFYLRLGTVLFGIGSLIYTGIEIGGIFEDGLLGDEDKAQPHHIHCVTSFTSVVRPGLQIIFIFSQMYFIFLNQKMNVYKHKLIGRLGLMHMIATNLCIWLKVLVMETKHEINSMHIKERVKKLENWTQPRQLTLSASEVFLNSSHHHSSDLSVHANHLGGHAGDLASHGHAEAYKHLDISEYCHDKIMFKLLEDSSPFLFPCTIEFSLICAAVLFIMWKNISDQHNLYKQYKMRGVIRRGVYDSESKRPELYSVDCSHANTGLFCGIVVLVVTIISLIIFFVFISNEDPQTRDVAVKVASVSELALYSLTTVAVLLGICQMRRLFYDVTRKLELDNLLLVIAQTGVFIYASFSIIGTFFQLEEHLIAFLASFVTMIQTPLQTVFILDASCRFAYTGQQVRNKPGREVVTFLLVCNLAMWMLNTLETNRTDSHPIQAEFYGGSWAWPMITHISMPLAIFYRFHSTVCLFEIWKKSFKYKPSHNNPLNL